jgi:hypothetical protein
MDIEGWLIEATGSEIAIHVRGAPIEQAWTKVLGDTTCVLLYRPTNVWVMRGRLKLPIEPWPYPDLCYARLK